MREFTKRIFAVLLSAVMLLGSMPSTVLAADNRETRSDVISVQEMVAGKYSMTEGEQNWKPNEAGVIEIPALDRDFLYGQYGIKVLGLDKKAILDFNQVSSGQTVEVSTLGTVYLSGSLKDAFDTKIANDGQVDIPLKYQEEESALITTLRFLNITDGEFNQPSDELKVYYTPADGEKQLVEEGQRLTVPVPEDQNGGIFSYEGLTEEEGYSYEWETSNEDDDWNLPISFDYFESGKLNITGAATVTISLKKYKAGDYSTPGETLFSCEMKATTGEKIPTSIEYEDSVGNIQIITETMDLYLQKGDTGSLLAKGDDVDGKTLIWKADSDSKIEVSEDGKITAKEAGTAQVSVTATESEIKDIMNFEVHVLDLSVAFQGTYAGNLNVKEGETVEVVSTETGTFSASGAEELPEGNRLKWMTEGDYQKPIFIASYTGELAVKRGGTAKAWIVIENKNTLESSVPLFDFTVKATEENIEDIKVVIDGQEIKKGDLCKVEGSEHKELTILGKFSGSDEFVEISSNAYKLSADSEIISVDDSTNSCGFRFDEPGKGNIIITYGQKEFSFQVESSYVPVKSLKLNLPDEDENTPGRQILMHELVYSLGDEDNYVGIHGTELANSYTVDPENASYRGNISWSNDNQKIASYADTHMNGFIGHAAGDTTITGTIEQGDYGETIAERQKVSFCYQYPVEALTTETPNLSVEKGKKIELPIQYTPKQPSQGLINWEQKGEGEVEVQRDKNGQYDSYSNLKYRIKGIKAGMVTLTGTPVSVKEGTNPSITFTIEVTGAGTETPEQSDTSEIVKGLKESAEKYYASKPVTWAYGEEWNVIAMKRAGLSMDKTDEDAAKKVYLDSVKAEIADPEGKLTEDAKPTDLARVIMALYSLGENPRDFAETDLIQRLLQSERLDQGSNEAIWTLLVLDAVGEQVPEGSTWSREKLVSEILEYQCADGSFGLSKSDKSGSVDMTAMALQALASYENKEDVKSATDLALDYLKEKIQEGDYKTVESDAQVAVALLMLGIDPCDKENGFAEDDITIYQAMEQYKVDEGGFKHQQSGIAADKMATQQVLLAVAAWERYSAGENSIYDMTDVASPVDPEEPEKPAPEEPSGYVTVAVEKFAIGQGYLVEPELVPIYKDMTTANFFKKLFRLGKNSTAAEVITQYLEDHNLEYEHTGTIEDSFYLSSIKDTKGSRTAIFPETTKKYAEENEIRLKEERKKDSLGEFDYSNGSGWKYTVNDDMTDKGMSQMILKDGDVVRVSFTAIALGQDLGNKEDSFMPVTNRDTLTRMLAEINSSDRKEEILASPNVRASYLSAIQTISDLEKDQESIDKAVERLKEAQENPDVPDDINEATQNVISLIEAIGGTVTLESKEAIQKARIAYDALSDTEKQQIESYYSILEAAEKKYEELEEAAQKEQKAAQKVIDKINAIGEVTINSGKTIQEARKAYDALTETQKALVTNVDFLKAAEDTYAKLNQEYLQEQKEKAKEELDIYKDLSEYRKEEQEELKALIEAGKKAIEEAQDVTAITKAKEEAMKKLDEVKTKEELGGEENKSPVTLSNSQYMISVTGKNLTEDMELQIIPLTAEQEAIAAMRKKIPSSKALIKPYEIRILKEDKEAEVEGPFTVKYQMDSKYNDKELQVFLMDRQNKLTEIKGTVKENVLSVSVDTLGSMAVVVDSSAVSSDPDSNTSGNQSKGGQTSPGGSTATGSGNVKTGDETTTVPFVCVMILSSIVITALSFKKKSSGK